MTTKEYCEEAELIQWLLKTNSITFDDTSNIKDLITNGVNFQETNPSIVIHIPFGGTQIQNIKLRSTNVHEIQLTFTTETGEKLKSIRTQLNNLKNQHFPRQKVIKLVIKILKTTDNDTPKGVTLSIEGCAVLTSSETSAHTSVTHHSTTTREKETSYPSKHHTGSTRKPHHTTTGTLPHTSAQSQRPTTTHSRTTSDSHEETTATEQHTTAEETTAGTETPMTTQATSIRTTGAYCQQMEYIESLLAHNLVTIVNDEIPNIADLKENGVNFNVKYPVINIEFPLEGAIVRDLQVFATNEAIVRLTFTTTEGETLPPIEGDGTSLPQSRFPSENITQIIIEIIDTIDEASPVGVTISVTACAPEIPIGQTQGKYSKRPLSYKQTLKKICLSFY